MRKHFIVNFFKVYIKILKHLEENGRANDKLGKIVYMVDKGVIVLLLKATFKNQEKRQRLIEK